MKINFHSVSVALSNKIKGGARETTYRSRTTNGKYKDYKYRRNEVNETHSTPGCTITGGRDNTTQQSY